MPVISLFTFTIQKNYLLIIEYEYIINQLEIVLKLVQDVLHIHCE